MRNVMDLDARWTKKHGKSYFGYKAHVSADVRHKLARKSVVTDAAVHDTNHFEDLLDETNTSRDVSADKGYVDRPDRSAAMKLKDTHARYAAFLRERTQQALNDQRPALSAAEAKVVMDQYKDKRRAELAAALGSRA